MFSVLFRLLLLWFRHRRQHSNRDSRAHIFNIIANNKMLNIYIWAFVSVVCHHTLPLHSSSQLEDTRSSCSCSPSSAWMSILSSRWVCGVAAVPGSCLLLSVQTAFKTHIPGPKVPRRQNSPSSTCAAWGAGAVGLDDIIAVVSIPFGIQGSETWMFIELLSGQSWWSQVLGGPALGGQFSDGS